MHRLVEILLLLFIDVCEAICKGGKTGRNEAWLRLESAMTWVSTGMKNIAFSWQVLNAVIRSPHRDGANHNKYGKTLIVPELGLISTRNNHVTALCFSRMLIEAIEYFRLEIKFQELPGQEKSINIVTTTKTNNMNRQIQL